MTKKAGHTKEFHAAKEKLFNRFFRDKDGPDLSLKYSLTVEEYIRTLAGEHKYHFALCSGGSFSRRELSPYSDIDLIFIVRSLEENKQDISELITNFWDNGIEVSHIIRDFSDINKFMSEDLNSFTQLLETRYLLGSRELYNEWKNALYSSLNDENRKKILSALIEDIHFRYRKYGDSPKILEPNVKSSAGGLRDLQSVEWLYLIKNKPFEKQVEAIQAKTFTAVLQEENYTTPQECQRLLESYRLVLTVRNYLHLLENQKNDRFEFTSQVKISSILDHKKSAISSFMKEYFKAANILNRFTKSMIKKFQEDISKPIPDSLAFELDEDFQIKGKTISLVNKKRLTFSDILRGFYYRGKYTAHFDESLRSNIVEYLDDNKATIHVEKDSSVFFREILKLPKNVGQTLSVMNELDVLSAFMPEFKDMIGFMQHGVYHCYTADEHTLTTIMNIEKLEKDTSPLGKIFAKLKKKDILYLALLFHDIAKPIDISGHEIIGAEMASSIMNRLGYSDDEIEKVTFLVKNHLAMEQVAFRRNLNDPETLNNFTSRFNSMEDLDLLYLLTYADLSAVNPAVWTTWKSELLGELYRKSKAMLEEQITGEELLISSTYVIPKEITKYSNYISESNVKDHINSINDIGYTHQFTDEEIARHIEEINKGEAVSVLFKQLSNYTNITAITRDYPALLSKLCGVLSINDANIHDAKIFTRKDGIVIDTFNVSEFRTHKKLEADRFPKIESDFKKVISGMLQLNQEFARMKTKWWRIESKFFKRTGKIKISFEKHDKYTIIDIFSPDRLGFLYQVTSKMSDLGLNIFFAKISTKGDDIVDSFYVLNRRGKKISSHDYELIRTELTETITQIL